MKHAAIALFGGAVAAIGVRTAAFTHRCALAELMLEKAPAEQASFDAQAWYDALPAELHLGYREFERRYETFRKKEGRLTELVGEAARALAAYEGADRSRRGRPPRDNRAPLWNVEPSSDTWVDRDDELTDIVGVPAHVQHMHVLSGLGGIGKSELAARASQALRHAGLVSAGWWVSAETSTTLIAGFADAARRLGLPALDDPEADARQFRDWIETSIHPWLIVFDNAPDAAAIRGWVPGGATHVIVTSRLEMGWPEHATIHRLDPLPVDEGVALLGMLLPDVDPEEARRVAREVGSLPLTLRGAASFVELSGGSLDEYLDCLDEDIVGTVTSPANQEFNISETWGPALDALGPHGRTLLRVCAWLDPDHIPAELLTDKRARAAIGLAATAAVEGRAELLRSGFLRRIDDRTWRIHRLLQVLVRRRLDPGRKGLVLAFDACLALWPDDPLDPGALDGLDRIGRQLDRCCTNAIDEITAVPELGTALAEPLARGGRATMGWLRNWVSTRVAARLGQQLLPLIDRASAGGRGLVLYECSQSAIKIAENRPAAREVRIQMRTRAIELLNEAGGSDADLVPIVMARLGQDIHLYDHDAGSALVDDALARARSQETPDALQLGRVLGIRAETYVRQGWFAEAASAAAEGAAVLDAAITVPHRTRSMLYANLGLAVRRTGDLAGAAAAFERALKLFLDSTAGRTRSSSTLASRLTDLGYIQRELGFPDEALALYREALHVAVETEAAPSTMAMRQCNVASTLSVLGRFEEADDLFRELLAVSCRFEPDRLPIRLRHWGLHLERSATQLDGTDPLRHALADQAVVALRWAHAGALLGTVRAEWIPLTERDLGGALITLGVFDEAETTLDHATQAVAALFGEHHYETAGCHAMTARLRVERGDVSGARSAAEAAAAIYRATFGEPSPDRVLPLYAEALDLLEGA